MYQGISSYQEDEKSQDAKGSHMYHPEGTSPHIQRKTIIQIRHPCGPKVSCSVVRDAWLRPSGLLNIGLLFNMQKY